MTYSIVSAGPSRSFPEGDAFLAGASEGAEVLVALGGANPRDPSLAAVLVELDTDYLGDFTGLTEMDDTRNVLGFARYRNGTDAPSPLVELVRNPWTGDDAVAAARAALEAAGLVVAVCADQPGRIIDRLVRPKYNAALRFHDEGLATQADMDLTCRMGLGYPDGPLERVIRGGLDRHHDVTRALFEVTGAPAYAPPRAAKVAARARKGDA